jgi:CheY-like chemotaxis protein
MEEQIGTDALATTSRTSTEVVDAERCLRAAPKCSVLVVDDDEGIRTALAEVLEILGYRVAVAADGEEAAELLRFGLEPNAIVLDMMMPRMDGWTFLSQLRADPKFHDVRVVVASAVLRERPAGADAWLQKPFEVSQLDSAVSRLCAH